MGAEGPPKQFELLFCTTYSTPTPSQPALEAPLAQHHVAVPLVTMGLPGAHLSRDTG